VLVLRELFMRSHRFDEIRRRQVALPDGRRTPENLEADGLVERRAYSERPLRHEYHLTEKGRPFTR
jgi:DNA-binding HxlR family transcriptional regulator